MGVRDQFFDICDISFPSLAPDKEYAVYGAWRYINKFRPGPPDDRRKGLEEQLRFPEVRDMRTRGTLGSHVDRATYLLLAHHLAGWHSSTLSQEIDPVYSSGLMQIHDDERLVQENHESPHLKSLEELGRNYPRMYRYFGKEYEEMVQDMQEHSSLEAKFCDVIDTVDDAIELLHALRFNQEVMYQLDTYAERLRDLPEKYPEFEGLFRKGTPLIQIDQIADYMDAHPGIWRSQYGNPGLQQWTSAVSSSSLPSWYQLWLNVSDFARPEDRHILRGNSPYRHIHDEKDESNPMPGHHIYQIASR